MSQGNKKCENFLCLFAIRHIFFLFYSNFTDRNDNDGINCAADFKFVFESTQPKPFFKS